MPEQKIMKLGMNENFGYDGLTQEDRYRLTAECGFDAMFCHWTRPGYIRDAREYCRRYGLIFQSVHAPYAFIDDFWHGTPEQAKNGLDILTGVLRECSECEVPMAVVHTYTGFDTPRPNTQGVYWFGRLLDEAERLGVQVGLENTEAEAYLDLLFAELKEHPAFGFNWDSGHESCYNRGRDMLEGFGDRLVGTHINDNMGVTGEEIFWPDDSHMIPYDGVIDWDDAAKRLARHNWRGILTFEMKHANHPGRHTHDRYLPMTPKEYLGEIYRAACRFRGAVEAAR